MSSYGYRLSTFTFTPHYKPDDPYQLNDRNVFGAGGAQAKVATLLSSLVTRGEADPKSSTYLRVDTNDTSNLGIYLSVSGGPFGESAEVVATKTHRASTPIRADDAILRKAKLILIFPPQGTVGIAVYEVKSNTQQMTPVVTKLNTLLRSDNIVLRLDASVADSVAWNAFLADPAVGVTDVELIQRLKSNDNTSFSEEAVDRTTLGFHLLAGSQVERRIRNALSSLRGKGREKPKLAGIVGVRDRTDDNFMEQRVVLVKDGRSRKINVTKGWPTFTYEIDQETQTTMTEFLSLTRDSVRDVLADLDIDLPKPWWPTP